MRRYIYKTRNFLLPVIDFFYPPFRKVMNLQTFRYAAAGGANALLGFLIFAFSFKFIFAEKTFDFGFYAFKGHIAALILSFCITFPIGFFMAKFVVFSDSRMNWKVQMFRYLMVCLFNLALNYILLKILVERFHIYPIIAQVITLVVVIVISYIAQRNFSFRLSLPENEDASKT